MECLEMAEMAETLVEGLGGNEIWMRFNGKGMEWNMVHDKYQRLSWDALCKFITGIVNRVNITNIKQIVLDLFSENFICGRGLFARSIMKAQAASLPFMPVLLHLWLLST